VNTSIRKRLAISSGPLKIWALINPRIHIPRRNQTRLSVVLQPTPWVWHRPGTRTPRVSSVRRSKSRMVQQRRWSPRFDFIFESLPVAHDQPLQHAVLLLNFLLSSTCTMFHGRPRIFFCPIFYLSSTPRPLHVRWNLWSAWSNGDLPCNVSTATWWKACCVCISSRRQRFSSIGRLGSDLAAGAVSIRIIPRFFCATRHQCLAP